MSAPKKLFRHHGCSVVQLLTVNSRRSGHAVGVLSGSPIWAPQQSVRLPFAWQDGLRGRIVLARQPEASKSDLIACR